jgi:hypothetical protein
MNLQQWIRSQWDRVGGITLVGIGLLVLLLGWLGISDQALPAAQIPYILRLMLVGIGATCWLSADLRDEWRKLDDLEGLLEQIATAGAERADTPIPIEAAGTAFSPAPTPIRAHRTSV